ncbi:uncharacterized protein LOC110447265 isoform X2 [Mizuhopecten yessoensis]|nr:uncharacterized protein LOC110447265 isoform X2 [Mizuhopecten yessoensis]
MGCVSRGPATQLTTMVLHQETKSWNEARQVCSADGGKLLSIQNPYKLADLLYMDSLPSWNSRVMTADLWFGLHTDVGASCNLVQYKWDDGEPLGSWSDWFAGSYTEPNSCESDLCSRISASKWKTIGCTNQYGFVCEYLGGTCGFETVADKMFTRGPESSDILDAQNVFVKMESTANLAMCLEACQTSSVGDLDCWFVLTNTSNADICYLYYTHDKYLADKAEHITETTGTSIHVKRCGSVAVYGETTTTASTTTTEAACVELTTTTASAATTTAAQTTTTVMTTTTAQKTTTTTTEPTTIAATQTTDGVECLKYSNETISYTASELQAQLLQLKADLTVLKTSTNRHMRTLTSVYDGRSSAVNIGVIGSLFLVVIPVLFFIADMPILYKHIRGRWDDDDDDDDVDDDGVDKNKMVL